MWSSVGLLGVLGGFGLLGAGGVLRVVAMGGVFVVVGTVRRVVVAVVHIVDMVAVLDRLMATPGPVLMAVALGLGVPRQRDAAQPGAHRRPHRRDDDRPDGHQHDGAAPGGVGGIRHTDPAPPAGDAARPGPRASGGRLPRPRGGATGSGGRGGGRAVWGRPAGG